MIKSLLELTADERFLRIESLASRPNLFKIVARTHTETWHSMFLGWLLDPTGSHGLGDFPLKRLFVAASKPTLQEDDLSKANIIAKIAAIGDLDNASVTPNEENQKEVSCDAGRIDVFITGINCQGEKDTVVLIEQKVHAPIDKKQCKKYADWLYQEYPDKNKVLLLLAPSDRLGSTIENTVGDGRWNVIDYQSFHDNLLVPVSQSSMVSDITSPLINQYIDTLRVPANGRKLAVTDEEKELALELYEKHKDAFDAIFYAINDTVDIDITSKQNIKSNNLKIKINDHPVIGKTVPEFYYSALKYLIDNEIVTEQNIPYETSNKRYLISNKAVHQGGNAFRVPVEYEGFFFEAHKSKVGAIKDLMKYLKSIGCRASAKE